jgi:MoaA/NifB/PqqE/SkfB family radical SAM enzyme
MRFPALLSAKLAKARVAAFFRRAHPAPLIDFVDAAEVLHAGSAHPVSHERIRSIVDSPAPILWIGGSEPLEHPGIAHLVRAIVQSGRFVFLETRGTLLRRRIHEFQPVPRMFLAVRIDGPSPSEDPGICNSGAFELALEGIRAAKLSGFLICLHTQIHADTSLDSVAGIAGLVRSLDLDGLLITQAAKSLNAANRGSEALKQKTVEARKLIRSRGWGFLSQLVETALARGQKTENTTTSAAQNIEQETGTDEESIRVA